MQQNMKMIAGVIVFAGLVIVGATMYTPGTTSSYQAQILQTPTISLDDDAVLGNADAPVSVIIFGDYQCPFCKKAADTAEKQMREEYVPTGKIKIVFRDYPLDSIHSHARPAAEAAQCAGVQGKYWEYHDALFARQSELGTLDYAALALDLDLNADAFLDCVNAKAFAAEVQKDFEDGVALGIEGTPATFINGKLIPGAYPYDTYKQEIERALQAAR